MWYVPLLVLATCPECCVPGGDCSRAYKGTPGICCGDGACCPSTAVCVRCWDGTRCAPVSLARSACRAEGDTAALLLLLCVACFATYACAARRAAPSAPVVPQGGAGDVMTGFVGGMILSDVMHDEPPSYVDVTFAAD